MKTKNWTYLTMLGIVIFSLSHNAWAAAKTPGGGVGNGDGDLAISSLKTPAGLNVMQRALLRFEQGVVPNFKAGPFLYSGVMMGYSTTYRRGAREVSTELDVDRTWADRLVIGLSTIGRTDFPLDQQVRGFFESLPYVNDIGPLKDHFFRSNVLFRESGSLILANKDIWVSDKLDRWEIRENHGDLIAVNYAVNGSCTAPFSKQQTVLKPVPVEVSTDGRVVCVVYYLSDKTPL